MNDSPATPASVTLDLSTFRLPAGTTLIEASAGTGKTYTIQYIVLDLLLRGIPFQEILVVTFTEAATQELRDRLQSFLAKVYEALSDPDQRAKADIPLQAVLARALQERGEDQTIQLIHQALLHADEAPIHTIHGFCQRALQENAFAADSPFESEICADPKAIIEELIRDFLRHANLSMAILPSEAAPDTLQKRAQKLTSVTRLALPYPGSPADTLLPLQAAIEAVKAFADVQDKIAAEFRAYQGKLNGNSYKNDYFEAFPSHLAAILSNPGQMPPDALRKIGRQKIEGAFKKGHACQVQSPFFAACDQLAEELEQFSRNFLSCFDTWFIQSFTDLKRRRGLMTYDDMILNLERALQSQERLRAQLRARYQAALVDEFQDTDTRQYNIFKMLFASDEADSDTPRYFAMIGDPKQSIYAFRGADINAYLTARSAAGPNRFTLPVNHRSEADMIADVNAFFAGANLGDTTAQDPRSAIRFEPVSAAARAHKPRLVFASETAPPRLFERSIEIAANSKFKNAQNKVLSRIAADVASLLQLSAEGRILLETDTENGPKRRSIEPGDIAVLVDTNKEAADIQSRLRQASVLAIRMKSGNIFLEREAADFLLFLQTCLDPRERNLNPLLVSPLYEKTDTGMKELSDAARQRSYELFNELGKSWREGASITSIWMQFLDAIDARAQLLARSDGERLMTNYLHICELAQELESSEALSPERLSARILKMVKDKSSADNFAAEDDLVRLESDEKAVKVLTMHASKGLEFPIVILPSLWQKGVRAKAKQDMMLSARPDDPDCMESLAPNPELVVQTNKAEALRIGYVAMTRSVHLCVYYNVRGIEKPKGHGSQNSNHKDGWFDLWLNEQRGELPAPKICYETFLQQLAKAAPIETPQPAAEKEPLARRFDANIPNTYQITSYSSLARGEKISSHSSEEPRLGGGLEENLGDRSRLPEDETNESLATPSTPPDLLLESFPGGARSGTCIHEMLEVCDFTSNERWREHATAAIQRHFPEAEHLLPQRVAEACSLLEQVTGAPCPLADSSELDLSSVGNHQRLHEMEFYFPVNQVRVSELERIIATWAQRHGLTYEPANFAYHPIDGFLTGSVDLFLLSQDRYYLLDWKTNSPLPGQPRLRSSYDRQGMHAQMQHGRYYLQALIYSVATAAFLRDRLGPLFDWETHIGGFVYCFVRGLGTESGWFHGLFSEEDVAQASDALGQSHSASGKVAS